MRVLTWPIPGVVDPEAVFAACWKDAPAAFWLDSGGTGTGTSYLGAASWSITAEELREAGQDVFSWLRAERTRWDVDTEDVPGGFALGLIGWLGYELYEETLGLSAPHPRRHPEALFMRVDRALAIDHATGQARLMARGHEWAGELATWRDGVLAAIAGAGAAFLPDARNAPVDAVVRWRHSDADYAARIRACQQAIADGDAYVLCLTTEVSVDGDFDPWEVYRRVRRTSPSHHGAYLRADGVALLSASPEQFLLVTPDGRASTKPIKGTRPRGATPEEDAAIAEELRRSDKERAENVMIVDLMRNDLSRVCEVGSVEVTKLLDVETYPPVHQLVSTVSGQVRPELDAVDVIRSCFPAGSMTGAPKRSAVSILTRLEARSRGVYSGAFGYLGYDGRVDLAMTIRSIVIDAAGAVIGTGGGITALSDADEEVEETRLKAAVLLRALGV
ncbi:MAG TPA: aminodeoxychorismate synthase component I [Microbacteriaceae bacterium]|nr:aminodeoxychorismate synthase component I [Microbacteriaceae bacterium]